MKCAETRTFIQLYLDSELDPAKSLEVERHLETCEECASLFEAETRFNARVASCLRVNARPAPQMWAGIEAKVQAEASRAAARARYRLVARLAPLAAMILLAVGGLAAWQLTRPAELAVAAVECHRVLLSPGREAALTANPPDADALRRTRGRLDARAFQYRPAAPGFAFKGFLTDDLASVPVAAIMGEYDAAPISLFVLKEDELVHFPNAKLRLESGEPVVCYRIKGLEFAARLIDGHVVCAVANLRRPLLETLLKSVEGPTSVAPKI